MSASVERRVFLSWDKPFLEQVVDWLVQTAGSGGDAASTFELSSFVAVVPTAQAGRRLREALALRAAGEGRAVFPPVVVEPEGLLRLLGSQGSADGETAGRLECLVAWAGVLADISLDDFRAVFPVDPPARNFAWGVRIGQQLMGVAAQLAERGLTFGDVGASAALDPDFPERRRWEELAALERIFAERLASDGLVPPEREKLRAAAAPVLPEGIERIVLCGVADPLPIAVAALEGVAARLDSKASASGRRAPPSLHVLVSAPGELKAAFDGWGRPVTEFWSVRPIDWTDFASQVQLMADPRAQAEAVAALARSYGDNRASLAVGCPDPEVVAPLEQALSACEIPSFNPQGRRRMRESFYHLVGCLADFVREGSFDSVEATGRCAEIIAYLRRRIGPSQFSAAHWLAGLDALRQLHLPSDLAAARRHAPQLERPEYAGLTAGLAALDELRRQALRGTFAESASSLLAEIFAGRRLEAGSADDAILAESAAEWMEIVRACGRSEVRREFRPEDWWDLALRLFGESWRPVDKPPGALELQGWMELLWEDAPHLVVAGLNEGLVPTVIAGDSFLPEALRERLGLKTNADRLARDAYLLQALAAGRARGGRLDILVGKASAQGDPLRPSRLLLLCPDAELPDRVRRLFRGLPPAGAPMHWTRAWRLVPPPAPADFPFRLGVTALRAWLECPFRFFLRHGLKMEAVDATKSEMDQRDFGTLCHLALQAMGEEPGLRECTDPDLLGKFLVARLEELVRRTYGAELSLPLVIQVESARQRLRRLARIQAQEQWAGWRIEAVERKITVELAGITVVAKIDRIDRHRESGAVRVLDYKTSDRPVDPADAHLRPLRKGESPRDFALWQDGSKTKVWQDLQLPLYRHALAAEYPELCACGYINLPKAVSESALRLWEPYTPELQAAAVACAEAVCRAIRAGEFWPPNPAIKPVNDDYGPLFHQGAAESVEWNGER